MLTQEDNDRLTRVGPGTPAGNMWRRYWNPVGCSSMVTSKPKRVKVLGEELVLYRGASGKPVLMQLRCAHRNVALDYGRVEGDAIRCPYHGWLFAEDGKCIAQPAEGDQDEIKDDFALKSYPTQEISGLIFAYMGPLPAPVLPIYDVMQMTDGIKQIRNYQINANWLQSADNLLDTTHFSWLHGYTFPAFGAKRLEAKFDRQDYGIDITLGLPDGPKDTSPYIFPAHNRFALPNAHGPEMIQALFFRTPTDDHTHENYMMLFIPNKNVPAGLPVEGVRFDAKLGEYSPLENDWWGIELSDQDRMAIEQQGEIADRTREHLVASDVGIVRMRRMLREGIDMVERGEDPIGIIRDPAKQVVPITVRTGAFSEGGEDTDYAVGLFTEDA